MATLGCAKPPSYAQVLAEKYGLSQLPSTSSEGFSDYHESDNNVEEEEEDLMMYEYDSGVNTNNNNEEEETETSLNTNEAIFMQRCIK